MVYHETVGLSTEATERFQALLDLAGIDNCQTFAPYGSDVPYPVAVMFWFEDVAPDAMILTHTPDELEKNKQIRLADSKISNCYWVHMNHQESG